RWHEVRSSGGPMQAKDQIGGSSPGSVVDIPRKKQPRTKRNVALAVGGAAAVVLITIGLSRLNAAAPTVDRGAVWTDTVKLGAMPSRAATCKESFPTSR